MCGICGIWQARSEVSTAAVEGMCACMIHRGPDGQGIYTDQQVGLGMRRLAIIDIDGGWQPISNEDNTIHIIFNGEIYNYVELREQLLQRGHIFKTNSDTETILHAYEDFGVDCLQYLNGMFAFAIWDQSRERLWVVRDRLGEKPLYYHWNGERLIFASEFRALLPALDAAPELDPAALFHYLSFQYIPAPYSMIQDIAKLPPAHYLLLEKGQLQCQKYWDVQFLPQWTDDAQTLQERLREEVTRAVRWRLRSDVPLGAFLSGGVDSAIIVALMARLLDRPVKAHTIAFDEAAFDESGAARLLAQHVGAEHHVEPVHLNILQDLPELVAALDEPFADASALPTYRLCQITRKSVTVALSGDGGDEVFGGYQRYSLDKLAQMYSLVPAAIRNRIVAPLANRLDVTRSVTIEANYALGLRRLQQVMSIPESASILRWGSYFSEPLKAELLHDEIRQKINGQTSADVLAADFHASDAKSLLGRTLYADMKNYLADNGMVKVDRMSMANSLEVRVPYLDHQLVEFMARVPDQYKVRGTQRKILLRQTFRDMLPPGWEKRPKRGFEVPVSLWFRTTLYDFAHSILLNPQAKISRFCHQPVIRRLLEEHRTGQDDHGRRLWALLILELWLGTRL